MAHRGSEQLEIVLQLQYLGVCRPVSQFWAPEERHVCSLSFAQMPIWALAIIDAIT